MPTYKLNPAAFKQALAENMPMMEAALKPKAEEIRARAEANASVGPPEDPHRGQWKSSFYVEMEDRGDRIVARVKSSDPLGVFKEYGHTTSDGTHVDGDHALLRALR